MFVAVVAVEAVFAVMLVLQLKPVPLVHSKALEAVLHDPTGRAEGEPVVVAPRIVLAACEGKLASATEPMV
jgi:hypothetical protein